ncbi:hypothetical protein TREMEDRAFT_24325 [Tremella mesenterica DSM 1558]|uniref:uncharacterized protein n=1 Tax=Tremella mesenterica (strain ATCC 24925 / CBS 8224 / DSM 1558 / NBRC 9311 / NRRL Y-6157 / RJB 2259-6 / UBC 559-6) TaxID=578456 RepID=UPI0003F497BE|nr:uncharacterized protein TREMEDRAFT_24325 [Tremella mesenterica DSM 1558]EIW72236.1 hypothetical protein TREMEDRAFT_24325 [Tremella mesenterica DSM 1558]
MASVNSDSLTLEETNKVRVSLGLAPIGGPVVEGEEQPVDRDEIAEANYAKRKEDEKRKKEEKEVKERIEKARNRSALNAKLKGSTLGDTNTDDTLSAKDWIKKQKKRAKEREKELALKRQKEMEEADAAVYDERDLAGLKVSHAADEFEEGQDIILTLKDSRVLAGEEDELQNVNLMDEAKLKAAKERKRKAQAAYTGLDDEEFDEGRIGRKADILGKYDEDFESGALRTEGFRLGVPLQEAKEEVMDVEVVGRAPDVKLKLNLDFTKDFEGSDYVKEGESSFKKPKKKKVKRSARRAEDEEDADGMEVDGQPTLSRRVVDDVPQNLVDDDDLQAALSRARREQAKKKPRRKPEDIAAQIASRTLDDEEIQPINGDEDGRITFDDTSEFVRNVNAESLASIVKRERATTPPSQPQETVVLKVERPQDMGQDEDMESEDEDEALAEMAAREGLSVEEYRLKIDRQMQEMNEIKVEQEEEEVKPLGQGLAGVLNVLKQQGTIKSLTAEDQEREKVQKQKDLWLADYRRRMAERELAKVQARGGNKDQAQREWENRVREQQEARETLELYKSYKPDINLVYHDEFGRQMTPKEAWKSLSHKFHGKTSGRMKTQKRLKKINEEQNQVKMSASDTPLGMTDAFARRQQKTGEAHMVLSVGNKGSVQAGDKKPKIRR